VKNGVPFDVAFALYPEEALAYAVVFGEFEGGSWNWESLSWDD
jgi:hypothetical protein